MSNIDKEKILDSKQGWGKLVNYYYEFRSEGGKFNSKDRARISEAPWMRSLLTKMIIQKKRVLDAGCGFGYYAFFAANLGGKVTAIDFSTEMIDRGRKLSIEHNMKVDFLVADVRDLPFDDASFDVIVSGMDLEIPDLNRAFANFARVLADKGQLLFSVPHPIIHHGKWETTEEGKDLFFKLDNYFSREVFTAEWSDEKNQPVYFQRYRRPLQDYTEALINNGFVISRLLEAEPTAESKLTDPTLYDELIRVPNYLVVQATKLS